jgi:hypothetical protein
LNSAFYGHDDQAYDWDLLDRGKIRFCLIGAGFSIPSITLLWDSSCEIGTFTRIRGLNFFEAMFSSLSRTNTQLIHNDMQSHAPLLLYVALLVTFTFPLIHGFLLRPLTHLLSSDQFQFVSQQQTPLIQGLDSGSDHYEFTVREQNDSICNAGVKQRTGLVNVSKEKKMFFRTPPPVFELWN